MTEVIDHGHSFISHREHKGHRVLIPDKSGLRGNPDQIPSQRDYRWKFAPTGAE